MISLAPGGHLVALCGGGRLLLVRGDARHEQPIAAAALAIAFDEEVWLVEASAGVTRLRRLSHTGEVLGERALEAAGAPLYGRDLRAVPPAAVLGCERLTAVVRAEAAGLSLSPIDDPPDLLIPARLMVGVRGGVARVEGSEPRRLSRSDLRVETGWSVLGGAAVALSGRDRRGRSVEVVGLAPDAVSSRLRVEPGVLVAASARGPRLAFADGHALTVFDVIQKRVVVRRELASRALDAAIDADGERVAVALEGGGASLVDVAASGSRPAGGRAAQSPAREEPPAVEAADRGGAAAGSMIAGEFVAAGELRGEVVRRAPADPDDVLGAFRYGREDVARAVDSARGAAARWGEAPVDKRIAALSRFDAELAARADELCRMMVRETGRPSWECRREIGGLSRRIEHTASVAPDLLRDRVDQVAPGLVCSRPWGVVGVIGPAMFPLATSHQHIVAALIAGNAVIWKPSPLATATARIYADALRGAGLPAGVAHVVVGPDEVGAELALHPGLDCLVFTGSTETGARLSEALATRAELQPILHLGAKNAAVVLADATIELAAYEIATSAFMSAGQRCTALSRAYVERPALDALAETLRRVTSGLAVGPPQDEPFCGPMLDGERLARFESTIERAGDEGAEPIVRGRRLDRPGHFMTPSIHIVEGPPRPTRYQRDEHFGPDLTLYPVDGLDEAIRRANELPYGLCGSLFSEDGRAWERFAAEAVVGTALRNLGTHSISGRLPSGGVRASGRGARAGADAVRALRRLVSLQERQSDVVDLWPGSTPPGTGRA